MRKTFLIIPISLLFAGCGESEPKQESGNLDSGTVKQSGMLDTCACSDLDIDSSGNHLLKESIFTGICVENYPETNVKYIEKNILNGKLHGKIRYFDKNGEVILEEVYEAGSKKRSGDVESLTCSCSELDKIETPGISSGPVMYVLDDIPFTGTCREYYPESDQVYMEVNYRKGLVHGFTTYYKKDGSTLLIEKYVDGMQTSVVH